MRNKTILLVLIVFFAGCSNFNFNKLYKKFARKVEREYYDTGCKKHSISFFNNKFDGPMLKWNEDCVLISEANYENGKLHGYWKVYYNDGQLMQSVDYFFGQKNGYERWYYKSGKIKTEIHYKFDVQISDMLSWDESGKLLN